METPYDCVPQGTQWGVLWEYGLLELLLWAIWSLYMQVRVVSIFSTQNQTGFHFDRRIGLLWWARELSRKTKPSFYQSIYVPAFTYGHNRKNEIVDIQSAYKMTLLHRVAWSSKEDRLGCFLSAFLWRVSRHVKLGGDLGVDTELVEGITYLIWLGYALGFHRRSWETLGRGTSGISCNKMDGWMKHSKTLIKSDLFERLI